MSGTFMNDSGAGTGWHAAEMDFDSDACEFALIHCSGLGEPVGQNFLQLPELHAHPFLSTTQDKKLLHL